MSPERLTGTTLATDKFGTEDSARNDLMSYFLSSNLKIQLSTKKGSTSFPES